MTEPTRSLSLRGKLQLPRIAMSLNEVNLQYRLFEGRNAGCSFFITLIDVYALFSDVSLRRQASMTQVEKFGPLFAQELALICSII